MSKLNSNEKRNEAIKFISEIITSFNNNKIQEIPQKSNTLVSHLFLYPSILYSEVNEYFETSGLLKVLISTLDKVQEIPRRHILRLIHLLLQVKRTLRDESRKSKDLQAFLFKNLDQRYCWENRLKFKHHINIASLLLVDRDASFCHFNYDNVRNLARDSIDDIINKNQQEEDDALPTIIFYACSMFDNTFEDLPKISTDETVSEMILSKSTIAKYSDFIRAYIQEFKIFYETVDEIDRTTFIYYKTKTGYSFQQLCNTFLYYAIQSDLVRMNVFQNGNYGMINNFLSIKYVPEPFLCCGLDFLKLILLDEVVLKAVKNNFQRLIPDKLNSIIKRKMLHERTKMTVQYFLEIFDTPNNNLDNIEEFKIKPPRRKDEQNKEEDRKDEIKIEEEKIEEVKLEGTSLIHITNVKMKNSSLSDSFSFEKWGTIDVQEWLADKDLGKLRDNFSHLTGRGLKQLQLLAKEGDRIKLVDFLMDKIKSNFDLTLELIDALESL